ncbi:MAG: hypothetical protein NT123_06685 [Proteobacteria bacterium]|nr:hypothetical protein [Pseudomonadota bacterium]
MDQALQIWYGLYAPAGIGVEEFVAFARSETERQGRLVVIAGMKGEGQ